MFIDTRESFKDFIGNKLILQANYYKKARKEMDLLLEDGKPVGGKWSLMMKTEKSFPKDT